MAAALAPIKISNVITSLAMVDLSLICRILLQNFPLHGILISNYRGLGTENEDMPAFVVLPDPEGGIKGGPPAWGSAYLPAMYQGTMVRSGKVYKGMMVDLQMSCNKLSERAKRTIMMLTDLGS